MKLFLSRLPMPITVLALAWVILGNVFQGVMPLISDMSMIISLILLVLIMMKILLSPIQFYKSIKSPVGLSLFSAFGLSLIMIAVWMKGIFDYYNFYFWVAGVIIHTVILLIFTVKYVVNFKIKYVFPSWFLIYSGFAMASITSKDFGMIILGIAIFKFVIIISIILVPFVLYRIFLRGNTDAAKPLGSLITLPVGLILSANLAVSDSVSLNLIWILFIISQILLVVVLVWMFFQMFDGFFPSWSSNALAVSIAVYAAKGFDKYLKGLNISYQYLDYLVYIEYMLAFLVCAVILLAYFINTIEKPEVHKEKIEKNHEKTVLRRERAAEKRARKRTERLQEESEKNQAEGVRDSRRSRTTLKKMDNFLANGKTVDKKKENILDDIENIEDLLD